MRTSVALALLGLLSAPAAAQNAAGGGGHPWMFAVGASTDENSYENAIASFYLGLSDATWLSLTAGTSRAPSSTADVRADLVSIGVEHDFGPVGIGLTAERWGDDGALEAQSWIGEIYYRSDTLRIGLELERRDVDLYFSGTAPPLLSDRRTGFDVDGLGIDGSWRLAGRWRLYGAWRDYDYPARLRLVPLADRLSLLAPSAVTLALGLVDEYARIGIERALGLKLVNVDFGSDRSAIDGSRLRSISGAVLWPVSNRVDLEVRLGSSRVDGYGSSLYGGVTALIYGGG